MSIVCGIDFSEPSREAARVAAAVARKRGEALILVHSSIFSDSEHAKLHAALDAEAAALRSTELIVSAELCFGWPDVDIERIADEANASLIVVGAVGHRRGTHWVSGSIPERIARETKRPLLVVRNGAPLEAWLRDTASLTCVVATDLTVSSRRVIEATNRMAALGRMKVILDYVVDHPIEYARLDLDGPIYHRRLHPVVKEVVMRDLQYEARTIPLATSVETRCPMTLGRTAEPLFFAADENGAELIVTGAHQRHGPPRLWHGSVAHDVLHGASTNVLIVPLHGEEEGAAALRVPNVGAVLAATDFSPGGDRALAWARAVTPAGARLRLTNVIREESERSGATEQLRRRAEALGVDAESCEVVLSKDVAAAIAAAGERFGAQLVCVGASGDGGTAHPYFGSVARGLLTRSCVPVLAVRET